MHRSFRLPVVRFKETTARDLSVSGLAETVSRKGARSWAEVAVLREGVFEVAGEVGGLVWQSAAVPWWLVSCACAAPSPVILVGHY